MVCAYVRLPDAQSVMSQSEKVRVFDLLLVDVSGDATGLVGVAWCA
jgi:hypothetical protein